MTAFIRWGTTFTGLPLVGMRLDDEEPVGTLWAPSSVDPTSVIFQSWSKKPDYFYGAGESLVQSFVGNSRMVFATSDADDVDIFVAVFDLTGIELVAPKVSEIGCEF